jgi:hypothetical protein
MSVMISFDTNIPKWANKKNLIHGLDYKMMY